MKVSKLFYLLLFLFLFLDISFGQTNGNQIILGERDTIYSNHLRENRPFLVYLPEDYSKEGEPVSVLYLLDGDGHFLHTAGIVSFLRSQNRIPNLMVVAIPNTTDRTHDLTPQIEKDTSEKTGFPTAGGADNMLDFLKDELIPKIEVKFNTTKYRILVGHSFGGLFSVNALLKEPQLFDAHISISPSLWWDSQHLVGQIDSALNVWDTLNVFYYMTMGNEGGTMLGGAMKLAALFEEKSPEDFQWDFKVSKEETHGSIPHRSTYNGLEAIFKDWNNANLEEMYVLGGLAAIEEYYKTKSKKFGVEQTLGESEINSLGYDLMAKEAYQSALEIFLENVKRFPESSNVYDSAGEAYVEIGEKDKAIEYYRKSLQLNPVNKNGIEMLKKLDVLVNPMEDEIKLSKNETAEILGTYKDDRLGTVDFFLDEEIIKAKLRGLPEQRLHAFPQNIFALTPADVILTFIRDSQGKITGFEVQTGIGTKQLIQKVIE